MQLWEIKEKSQGKIHHHCIVTKIDGTTVEGHFQPNSNDTLYITPMDSSTGKCITVPIASVKSLEWPDD